MWKYGNFLIQIAVAWLCFLVSRVAVAGLENYVYVSAPFLADRCSEATNCEPIDIKISRKCLSWVRELGNAVAAVDNEGSYLQKWGSNPITLNFLNQLKLELNKVKIQAPRSSFNLWTFTLGMPGINGDKSKAMELLGSIFSDKKIKSKYLSPEIESLRKQIFPLLIYLIGRKKIEGFPPGVDSDENNGSIYHFYTIGLIAQHMKQNGTPERFATTLPYSLNALYEDTMSRVVVSLITTQNFTTRRKCPIDLNHLPPQLAPQISQYYAGYAGVAFALSKESERFTGQSLAEFQTKFNSGDKRFIGDELAKGLGGKNHFCNSSCTTGTPCD